MNNSVSPVTESEMNEWFKRLSTMIVSASEQSYKLESVQNEVRTLHDRVADLVTQNDKLKAEVAETWQLVTNVEKERDEAKADAERTKADLLRANEVHAQDRRDYEDRLAAAHDAMAGRDQAIAGLQGRLNELLAERDNWQEKAERWERQVQQVQGNADYWRDRWNNSDKALTQSELARGSAEKAKTEAETKLASIQALFQPKPAAPAPATVQDAVEHASQSNW